MPPETDTPSNNELQRALGRIEGSVTALVAQSAATATSVALIQQGVAAITQDNLQCHIDRQDHSKRLVNVERRQVWLAGASASLGAVVGFVSSHLPKLF